MNFGQHWRTPEVVEAAYRLELPTRFFLDYAEAELLEVVEDIRLHPDPTFDLDRVLIAAGLPVAGEALLAPELAATLAEYFAHDLLLRWLGDGPPDAEPGFVLNSIDLVRFGPEVLRIEGQGRASGVPVRYQDV